MNRAEVRRAIGAAAVVIVTVGVADEITSRAPQPEDWQRPYTVATEVGEAVRIGQVDVTVLGIDGARSLDAGDTHPSAGVWLIVRLRVEAVDEATQLGTFTITDERGRTHATSGRVSNAFQDLTIQPAVPVRGAVAVEVPRDTRGDLRVRYSADRIDPRADEQADVRVEVDDADWARWAATEDAPLPTREVGA